MKAITLHQPWASMIFDLDAQGHPRKPIETRAWGCFYKGDLAIHAGKKFDREYCLRWGYDPAIIPLAAVLGIVHVVFCAKLPHANLWPHYYWPRYAGGPLPADYEFRCADPQWATGDFSPGRWGWKLEVIERFSQPIPARGARLLWEWTPKK
jgi:hypothetical protein